MTNKEIISQRCKQGSAESLYCSFMDEDIEFSVDDYESWGFEMYNPSGTQVVDDSASVHDSEKNIVRYDMVGAQTATTGKHKIYFVGINGTEKTYFPRRWHFTLDIESK